MLGRIDKACQSPMPLIAVENEVDCIKIFIDRWISQWSDGLKDTRKRWHLLHEALTCQLLLLARIRLDLSEHTPRPRYRQTLVNTAVRMFEEALDGPTTTHMTHRASIFTFAASLVIRYADRRDLVLRLALRLAGHADRPSVPTTRRDAGRQMLAMLCASQQVQMDTPLKPEHAALDSSLVNQPEHSSASQVLASTAAPATAPVSQSASTAPASAQTMESLMASLDYFSDIFDLSTGRMDTDFMTSTKYPDAPALGLSTDSIGGNGSGPMDSAGLSMIPGNSAYASPQPRDSTAGSPGGRAETAQLPFCESPRSHD